MREKTKGQKAMEVVRKRMATYSNHKRKVLGDIAQKVFNASTPEEVKKLMKEYRKASNELE